MSKFLRILWAWCLAVALPLQGYAAQAVPCMPTSTASNAIAAHAQRATQRIAAPLVATHANASDCHAAAGMTPRCTDDDAFAPDQGAHADPCSAGASCCGALAIMAHMATVTVVPPGRLDVPTVPAIRDRVMVSGLDRPPRSAIR